MIKIRNNNMNQWKRLQSSSYFRELPKIGIGEPTPPVDNPRRQVLLGDATEMLKTLPDASVDCVVTSPPYFNLRDYQVDGQLGLEPNIEAWVTKLRTVFAGVARVLKPAGSVWLNLGDSFSHRTGLGAPAKSMLLGPERLLLALASDGWIVRGKVIWHKPNVMPNSVGDRLNVAYEVVYFLVRSQRYYFNLDAIREPHRPSAAKKAQPMPAKVPAWQGPGGGKNDGLRRARAAGQPGHALGKNPGDVWKIQTKGFRDAHFATFPPELVRRPILASCPEEVCTSCGVPWKRAVRSWRVPVGTPSKKQHPRDAHVYRFKEMWNTLREVGDLVPCGCSAPTVPGIVLDPFFGAGTTGLVAESLKRDWLGIEISEEYRDLALKRIGDARGQR